MKNLSTSILIFCLIPPFIWSGCVPCDAKFGAGLNLENSDRCRKNPEEECYSEVFACPGDKVHLCWLGNDKVTKVSITGLGERPKEGCETIIASNDAEYIFMAENTGNSSCQKPIEQTVKINVIKEGETIELTASNNSFDSQRLLWEIKYPEGQVSPNIVVTSIKAICGESCYPLASNASEISASDRITADGCGAFTYCNGSWSCLKINPDGSGIPNAIAIVPDQIVQFSAPFVPLVGTWQFTPSGTQYPSTNSVAIFKLTVKCVEN